MAVFETNVFIKKPLEVLVEQASSIETPVILKEGSEIAYVFGSFGLLMDKNAEVCWTQLLHQDRDNVHVLAKCLSEIGVSADDIFPMTNWAGHPLIDIQAIKDLLGK